MADDKDIERRLHDARLATLNDARGAEREAQRLRREGREDEARAAYDRASDLYVDSNFAFDCDGGDLVDEVRRAIERCKKIVENIRYPKDKRPPATTPRPNCLGCDKPLRRYKFDVQTFSDGTPREWGDYGDNRFCGLRCGWRWACSHTTVPRGKKH